MQMLRNNRNNGRDEIFVTTHKKTESLTSQRQRGDNLSAPNSSNTRESNSTIPCAFTYTIELFLSQSQETVECAFKLNHPGNLITTK